MEKSKFHYSVSTTKDVEQVIQDLEISLKEIEFGVLFKFEIHKKLEEKGLLYDKKITVLEVCNPNDAHGILEIDPMASYFLPCKVVVLQDENETKVGFVSPTVLIGLMENKELDKLAKEVEDKLIDAIDRAI